MNVEAVMAFAIAVVGVAPFAWQRGRAHGYREGLHDKYNVINNVYGPGWQSRLIAHEHCPQTSPLAGDPTKEEAKK